MRYIRAAQAFAATTSYVAQGASPGVTDLRDFHYRVHQNLVYGKGTTRLGTVKSLNTNERYLAIQDDVWASVVAAGVNVADLQYNSTTDPGVTNTSEVLTLPNLGTLSQVIICEGDSITNGKIGANAYKKFALSKNQLWARGMGSVPGGITYVSPVAVPSSAAQPLEYCYHNRSAHEKSRLKFNKGADSWRLANQTGFNYQTPTPLTGAPHNDNVQQFAKLALAVGQQLVVQIFAGTNDIDYADRNGNPGLAAVPPGTPGATYTGSPNYITDALVPNIAAIKAAYPMAKILFVVPLARGTTTALNGKFNDIANYVIANKVALGVDMVLDTRVITQFSCQNPTVTTNTAIYQDGTHPTPTGVDILDPYFEAAYDLLLGFTPNPTYAGALK